MEKTVLNIKTDKKLKKEAQETARELGLPLGTVMNAYLRDFVRERRVVFSIPPTPNARTRKILDAIERDIKTGKNAAGPFSADEAVAYLNSK